MAAHAEGKHEGESSNDSETQSVTSISSYSEEVSGSSSEDEGAGRGNPRGSRRLSMGNFAKRLSVVEKTIHHHQHHQHYQQSLSHNLDPPPLPGQSGDTGVKGNGAQAVPAAAAVLDPLIPLQDSATLDKLFQRLTDAALMGLSKRVPSLEVANDGGDGDGDGDEVDVATRVAVRAVEMVGGGEETEEVEKADKSRNVQRRSSISKRIADGLAAMKQLMTSTESTDGTAGFQNPAVYSQRSSLEINKRILGNTSDPNAQEQQQRPAATRDSNAFEFSRASRKKPSAPCDESTSVVLHKMEIPDPEGSGNKSSALKLIGTATLLFVASQSQIGLAVQSNEGESYVLLLSRTQLEALFLAKGIDIAEATSSTGALCGSLLSIVKVRTGNLATLLHCLLFTLVLCFIF